MKLIYLNPRIAETTQKEVLVCKSFPRRNRVEEIFNAIWENKQRRKND